MAGPAFRRNVDFLPMRSVAASAPKLSLALPRAAAQGQLFGVTDHSKIVARPVIDENRKILLQRLSYLKARETLSRTRNSCLAAQMTLLANTVSLRNSQASGIQNGRSHRLAKMCRASAMTALARDRLGSIQPAIRVAVQAIIRDSAIKIRAGIRLVSRSHIPHAAAIVESNRRLE
jgi:hypothetical protein